MANKKRSTNKPGCKAHDDDADQSGDARDCTCSYDQKRYSRFKAIIAQCTAQGGVIEELKKSLFEQTSEKQGLHEQVAALQAKVFSLTVESKAKDYTIKRLENDCENNASEIIRLKVELRTSM